MTHCLRLKQLGVIIALLNAACACAQNIDSTLQVSAAANTKLVISDVNASEVANKEEMFGTKVPTNGDKNLVLTSSKKLASTEELNIGTSAISKADIYGWKSAQEDLDAIKWEAGGAFAGITAIGVKSWDWGTSSFHLNSEGWFGKKTGSGGTDKLGHAFTSYALTNAFAERLQAKGRSPERAALSAALLSQALMLYVEIFDGVSGDHGFSKEDMLMNALGIGLAYLRQTHPRLKDLVDYRMEYNPSGYKGFRPLSDYEGQKFLLALKLSGIPSLRKTPLKFVELQAGYYTRGFSKEAKLDKQMRARHGFVGVGINLSQLVFGTPEPNDSTIDKTGRFVFEHIQIPSTAFSTENKF